MLPIDLTGKRAFVAGVADDGGYGFAIAKALAEVGPQALGASLDGEVALFLVALVLAHLGGDVAHRVVFGVER